VTFIQLSIPSNLTGSARRVVSLTGFLEPIRLAVPFYSGHPADALAHVDLTKIAVVTHPLAVDTAATGSVRITGQYPGFIHIAAQTSGPVLCMLAQRLDPGWTARIGESRLQLLAVDGDLTGFVLRGENRM